MTRVLLVVVACLTGLLCVAGGAPPFGVGQLAAQPKVDTSRYGDGLTALKDAFFAALSKGDVGAIKALCEPGIAERIAAGLGEKGLVRTSSVWVRTGGWPAPSGRDGTAYFGLEAKDGSGKAIPFRVDLDSSRTGGSWVWRITGIAFDVKF